MAEEANLGVQGKTGIVHNRQRQAAFLSDPTHRIVFHSTPTPGSWRNQIESWLRILVRKLLTRGACTSVDDRKMKLLRRIDSDNRTMAKPCTWTYA